MSEQKFLKILREYIRKAGSQKAAAEKLGVSQPYICDLLAGNRQPGEKILSQFGLKKEVVFVKDKALAAS
jgi:predicted XRE-type DNA-binding protein